MSFYLPLAALIQTPKRADLGVLQLFSQDLNVSTPTSEPTTPQVSFTVTSPSLSGDTLRLVRRWLWLHLIMRNTPAIVQNYYVRVKINGVERGYYVDTTTAYAYYWSHGMGTYVNDDDVVEIYAWAGTSSVTLRRCFAGVIYVPKVSSKLSSVFGVRVSSATFQSGLATTKPASIGLAHDDVVESSLTATGFGKLTNVAAPSLWVDEAALTRISYGSGYDDTAVITILYPSVVVWTE